MYLSQIGLSFWFLKIIECLPLIVVAKKIIIFITPVTLELILDFIISFQLH